MDEGKRIAFVCAMPIEAKPLVKRLGLAEQRVGGVTLRAGRCGRHQVVAVVTGMGTDLARTTVTKLLDATPIGRVVVVGITGGVRDDVPIGTRVRPASVRNSTTGAEFHPEAIDDGPVEGTMWTTDVITKAEELASLREQGIVSLDMETAAVAEVCEARGIPWSVIRIISDRPDDEVDDEVFRLSNQDGTPNPKAIARYVARHPGAVPGMARMGRNVQKATEAAAAQAIAAVEQLG